MKENKGILSKLKMRRVQWAIIILFALAYGSLYISVPYFITMPGSAMELKPIVEVQRGYAEKGEFMLTTVSMMPANLPTFIYSKFNGYMETIPKENILIENEKQEEYTQRQIQVMKESQNNAILAAFHYLHLPITVQDKGILVMSIVPNLPIDKVLKVGDIITSVDNQPMKKIDDLLAFLKNKHEGEQVDVKFIRDQKTFSQKISLVNLALQDQNKGTTNEEKIGLGIYPYEDKDVIPSKHVVFHTDEIGGPSAGLMFTLEIINQLTPNDLTGGHLIAGTGTISPDGVIGQIGGAKLKVKAAYEKGAEIFFVPKDLTPDDVNQKDAIESNKILGNHITIVPVASLSEAINYLKKLPPVQNVQK